VIPTDEAALSLQMTFPNDADVLAIVGSRKLPDSVSLIHAHRLIDEVIERQRPDWIISGGAPGIDTLARQVASMSHIPFHEFLPRHQRWKPEGYEERNQIIADRCTRLMCIRSRLSETYGSGWTADRCEDQHKKVWRIEL
jgi:hypothetical protein